MPAINKLLDTCREICGSDAQTGRAIGVTRSAVSLWRQGGAITVSHLARLLDLADADAVTAIEVMKEQEARLRGFE